MHPASELIQSYREDILLCARVEFGFTPDPWQRKAMIAFADKDHVIFRIALSACVGPGKSAVLAILGWWFLLTQGEDGNHPKGAVLSCTEDNLKDNMWSELAKWGDRSALCRQLFTQSAKKIFSNDHPKTWFMSARSFPRAATPEDLGRTLSGLHARYVFFLVDECGAIHPNILKSAEQALSTVDIVFGRICIAGNPSDLTGMLYQVVKRDFSKWHIVYISSDPTDPDRTTRVSEKWAQEQIELYGRDDPWVRVHIMGKFPLSSIQSLLSDDEVEESFKRTYRPEEFNHAEKRLGVDVAGSGIDLNVLYPRQGLVAFNPSTIRQCRPSDLAARILLAKQRWGVQQVFVDSTGGWGSGTIDAMLTAGHHCHAINFADRKTADPRFYNKRAEMWWKMAEWVKRGGALPKCDYIKRELTNALYSTKEGKFLMEPKDQLLAKLGWSPDRSDALALTFALGGLVASALDLQESGQAEASRRADDNLAREESRINQLQTEQRVRQETSGERRRLEEGRKSGRRRRRSLANSGQRRSLANQGGSQRMDGTGGGKAGYTGQTQGTKSVTGF